MSKIKIIAIIAIFVFITMACGGSSKPEVNAPSNDSQPVQQQASPIPEVGSARSNPAPIGSEVVADNMAFTITGTIRPANDKVTAGNMFNSTPEAGQEYIFVELNVVCKKSTDEKCSINPTFNMNLLGSLGIEYDPNIFISGVEGLMESTEFYGDASVKGYIPFIVGVGETDLVLLYDPFLGDTFYLAIP